LLTVLNHSIIALGNGKREGLAMQGAGEWLESLGLSEYTLRFAENYIDSSVLCDLTDQDLEKIGIPLGHRKKMLRAIAELRGIAPAERPAVAQPLPEDTAERRQVTVMFCDLVGSTALSARLDPEDVREIISAYQKCVAEAVRRFDGFVAKYMGDGVLVYFGYPRAHEDDAERAVRAGLEIIRAVGALNSRAPLQARVGIATGLVVVGDLIGSGEAQERGIIGETPNLAARLQALAEPGTIVVAASTRRLLGNLFKLRDLGRYEIKGLVEPIKAWAVESLSTSESRFDAAHTVRLTGFVGREAEIELLLDRKNMAWQGEGQIVLISGEAGIGKSRLAAQLSERVTSEPHTRLRYQCSPYHRDSALHPFIAQLERAAGFETDDGTEKRLDKLEELLAMGTSRVRDVAPLFAALLSIPFVERYPPLTLSPTQQRRQTLAALLDQFEGLAGKRSILLFFEDLHWADPTSIELLDLTVDRIRHLPVLAIFTFRPEFEPLWAGLPNVRALELQRLDERYVHTIVEQVTGGRRLPGEVMGQIVKKTDGVPLFVEELTKTVLEAGILVEDAGSYQLDGPLPPLAIPSTLHDSLMARLDRLAAVKEIAQIGAAIGREFPFPLLRAVVSRDEAALRSALVQLEAAELLFHRGELPEAVFAFKHALVQDAAYESLLKSRRQVLHRRIAEALCEQFPAIAETEPEVVAHHFTQAGLTEAAVGWWGKAGERALNRSAYSEAIAHLKKALGLVEELPDGPAQRLKRLRVQTRYGYALLHGRGHGSPETIDAFARARELASAVEGSIEIASTYYGLWAASFVRAELTPMREASEAFLREAQRWPGSLELAVAHRMVGTTCWFQGGYADARAHLQQALSTYDRKRDRHLASRFGFDVGVQAMTHFALVLWPLGELDQAVSTIENGLSLAEQTGHAPTVAFAHFYTCLLAALRRNPDQATTHAGTLLALGREHGLPLWLAHGTFLHAWARWWAGDRQEIGAMRDGLTMLAEMNVRHFGPLYGTLLAEIEAGTGDIEAGLTTLAAQFATITQTGERCFLAEMHRVHGELLLRRAPLDLPAASAAFMRAIEIARSQQTRIFELRAALSLAKLYQATGRRKAARELLAPTLIGLGERAELPEVEEAKGFLANSFR
jgi:class 3 adenylate cyclase/predicted ATPase